VTDAKGSRHVALAQTTLDLRPGSADKSRITTEDHVRKPGRVRRPYAASSGPRNPGSKNSAGDTVAALMLTNASIAAWLP